MRVIIRFIEKPIPYYSVEGRGWKDLAATADEAVAVAALRSGILDDDSIRMRIAWEDVPDDFIAPDMTFMDIPESGEGYLN